MAFFKNFIKINQQICKKIERLLPQAKIDITNLYSQTVAEYANSLNKPIIVDVGGGRLTPFAHLLKQRQKIKLVIVDKDENELKRNHSGDKKIIMEGSKVPLKNESANLIVSRYTLEHLENIDDFIASSFEVLKKNGCFIHLFSCKFAPFSLLNQLFPHNFSQFLLNIFVPESKSIRGFKTYYQKCYYSAIINLLKKNGFKIQKITLSYYQSRYYSSFLPLYLFSISFEFILYFLNLENLCAYILIEAKK